MNLNGLLTLRALAPRCTVLARDLEHGAWNVLTSQSFHRHFLELCGSSPQPSVEPPYRARVTEAAGEAQLWKVPECQFNQMAERQRKGLMFSTPFLG
ncbi:Tripartite Motif-Containing Protein 61-Like [Manis pentadactyla]|nr:Tripartite Motif-Containing Protein 61-Like [Manis pentadactyla]